MNELILGLALAFASQDTLDMQILESPFSMDEEDFDAFPEDKNPTKIGRKKVAGNHTAIFDSEDSFDQEDSLEDSDQNQKSWILRKRYKEQLSQAKRAVIKTSQAAIYELPLDGSPVIKHLTKGQEVEIVSEKNGWLHLRSGGYIHKTDTLLKSAE